MKQGDVIRSGGFEAVPHLLGLGCVIWGREKAVAGSFVRSAVSLGQRGGVGRQAGVQAATAPPPPGAAERPLMPTPGGGGSRLGRGLLWGRGREPPARRRRGGGAGGETRHFPTPPPRGAAAATELLGLIQVRRWGRDRRGCLSCFLSCCCPCRRRGRGPHPTPPQRGSSRGQNEASCGPASCRRACSGPAPSAERRGQLWLAHPHSPAVSQLSLAASVSAFLCVGSVPDSENYLP